MAHAVPIEDHERDSIVRPELQPVGSGRPRVTVPFAGKDLSHSTAAAPNPRRDRHRARRIQGWRIRMIREGCPIERSAAINLAHRRTGTMLTQVIVVPG